MTETFTLGLSERIRALEGLIVETREALKNDFRATIAARTETIARLVEREEYLEECKAGACDHDGPPECLAAMIRAFV